ncbi:MAG TPA: hypothetical protein VK753_09755 [Xanthomonadaceae bacterium]|jgi:hypothetical protein|nr:hypothetical protein [Xanthomonadaceae bacterium]
MNAHDIELALRARAAFNDSTDRLDPDTRRRLRDLRLRALQGKGPHARARWMWPAGVATASALALAVFIPHLPQLPTTTIHAPAAGVVPSQAVQTTAAHAVNNPVAAAVPDAPEATTLETADPDMLSDLDFYGWLAKQPGNGNTGG